MDKEEFLQSGLLEQYVLGLTEPEETRLVEEFLESHPDLRTELQEMHRVLEEYASKHAIPPPKNSSITATSEIASAQTEIIPLPRGLVRRSVLSWTLIALLAVGALSTWLFRQWRGDQRELVTLEASLATVREECDRSKEKAAAQAAIYALLEAPETRPILLAGSELSPDHFALAYWNPVQKQVWINPANLPPLPTDRQYQVWADIDGEMISIGLLTPGLRTPVSMDYRERTQGINITQEPMGGSEHPTLELLTAAGSV